MMMMMKMMMKIVMMKKMMMMIMVVVVVNAMVVAQKKKKKKKTNDLACHSLLGGTCKLSCRVVVEYRQLLSPTLSLSLRPPIGDGDAVL